jgi:hypothetical protein
MERKLAPVRERDQPRGQLTVRSSRHAAQRAAGADELKADTNSREGAQGAPKPARSAHVKRALIGIILALAAGCGGSDTGGDGSTKNLANFQGSTWSGTTTTTLTCPGSPAQTGNTGFTVAFSPGTGADLQYTSQAGCTYKFNVSGNTASLSNAPVTCSTIAGGTTINLAWTSYSVTTSDGHNLTFTAAGTASDSTQTCNFSMSGSATR